VARRPIGIFDSGVGGLSVAREIRRGLPAERLVYVADTAYCPYGDRPTLEVRARALAITRHLEATLGAKLVVAACNTATGAALEPMRQAAAVPIVGLEPAVKTGAAVTRNGRVGVMATSGTLASERFARLVRNHPDLRIVPQPCPGLANIIEEGDLDGPGLGARLAELAEPLRHAEVDTVVLGCTHYAFVAPALARVFGPGVELVDSGPAIARRAEHILRQRALLAGEGSGSLEVLTTGDPARVERVVVRLWGGPVSVRPLTVASNG